MNTKNSSTIAAFLSIQQFLKHKMAQEYIPVAGALPLLSSHNIHTVRTSEIMVPLVF